jgi:hypothetical protein
MDQFNDIQSLKETLQRIPEKNENDKNYYRTGISQMFIENFLYNFFTIRGFY